MGRQGKARGMNIEESRLLEGEGGQGRANEKE